MCEPNNVKICLTGVQTSCSQGCHDHGERKKWSQGHHCCRGACQVVLVVKNLPAKIGDIKDASSIPALERYAGEGHGDPLQLFSLGESQVPLGTWRATVHGVAKSQTWLKRLSTHVPIATAPDSTTCLTTITGSIQTAPGVLGAGMGSEALQGLNAMLCVVKSRK